ncbi:MAG: hypothetical protein ABI360_09325 [Allobranchiibius sp.]
MSIPSITVRLDFGAGDVSSGIEQQSSAPTPLDNASLGAPTAEDRVPVPSGNALGPSSAAAAAPPEPSPDVFGLAQEAAGDSNGEDPPQPEGDPSEKKVGRK